MAFGYQFINLSKEEKEARRVQLNEHANYAQFSVLAVLVVLFVTQYVSRLANGHPFPDVDSANSRSPQRKRPQPPWARQAKTYWAWSQWWMGGSGIRKWGTRGEWVGGTLWSLWMLFLCVQGTGNDYLHLTKRFGIVTASFLPFQHLLAIKSLLSPVQILTRLSHEQIKPAHQVLGRIIAIFLLLHGSFYLNYFIQSGMLGSRITEPIVICGLVSLLTFLAINAFAFSFVRQRSYGVFYTSHITLSALVLGPLFFHVPYIRPYLYETLAVFVAANVLRVYHTHTYSGHLSVIPGTNLIKISIPLSNTSKGKHWKPGQHVYLRRLPGASQAQTPLKPLLNLLPRSNPFTIASLPKRDGTLLLIARPLHGATHALPTIAAATPTLPLSLEGPFGATATMPALASFDSVLFVAGGVGGTFTVPLYRSLVEDEAGGDGPKVRFVWAVRNRAETRWAGLGGGEEGANGAAENGRASKGEAAGEGGGEDDPEREWEWREGDEQEEDDPMQTSSKPRSVAVEIYVTRHANMASRMLETADVEQDLELAEADRLLEDEDLDESQRGVAVREGRPRLSAIVDQVFAAAGGDERVAVLVCGPQVMGEAMREAVEKWVYRGRDVYYHVETFGW